MKEFDKIIGKPDKAENTKAAEGKAEQRAKDSNGTMQQTETSKRIVKLKNKNSELPTFDLQFKKEKASCEVAWGDAVARLVYMQAASQGETEPKGSCRS